MKTFKKVLSILLSLSFILTILATSVSAAAVKKGDLDGDGEITRTDAIELLYHSIFPDEVTVNQKVDFDKDGEITRSDAIYLLYHSMFPEDYPLDTKPQPLVLPVTINSANCVVNNDIVSYKQDGSAYIASGSIVAWNIPMQVMLGDSVTVTIKGSSVGQFRVWLLTSGQGTYSNQFKSADQGFNGGNFEYTFELTAADADNKGEIYANAIAFKAPSWDAQLNQLTISSIEITYPPEEEDIPSDSDTTGKTKWVASWGSAQLQAGDEHKPNMGFANNTVRQQIRMTLGGETVRFVFSNEYGKSNLVINGATVAHLLSPTSPLINDTTLTDITFNNGQKSVTIPAGQTITSDEISFRFKALDDLAVSLYFGSVPTEITSHTNSRCSIWFGKGDMTKSTNITNNEIKTSWYFLSRVDVAATEDCTSIVCLGDSLTDGASVTNNIFSRWPDELARKFQSDDELKNRAVINMGIGGTPFTNGWGESGVKRFTRDVLNVPGIEAVVILYGTNDIGYAGHDVSQGIIDTYKSMITQCHARGIEIYGCTITPNKGSGHYSDDHEKYRLKVNEYILSANSGLDGYIDTAAAVANPSDTSTMQQQYVSVWNDWLHFNDRGYCFVGETVYNKLCTYLKD